MYKLLEKAKAGFNLPELIRQRVKLEYRTERLQKRTDANIYEGCFKSAIWKHLRWQSIQTSFDLSKTEAMIRSRKTIISHFKKSGLM